jgi:hypothetical protein
MGKASASIVFSLAVRVVVGAYQTRGGSGRKAPGEMVDGNTSGTVRHGRDHRRRERGAQRVLLLLAQSHLPAWRPFDGHPSDFQFDTRQNRKSEGCPSILSFNCQRAQLMYFSLPAMIAKPGGENSDIVGTS